VVLGVFFLQATSVIMGRVFVLRIGVQFPHKLLEFTRCSCFFTTFMGYFVIAKKMYITQI
jgi:hypothetical protein